MTPKEAVASYVNGNRSEVKVWLRKTTKNNVLEFVYELQVQKYETTSEEYDEAALNITRNLLR